MALCRIGNSAERRGQPKNSTQVFGRYTIGTISKGGASPLGGTDALKRSFQGSAEDIRGLDAVDKQPSPRSNGNGTPLRLRGPPYYQFFLLFIFVLSDFFFLLIL